MPKAILEFTLPEDQEDFENATNGTDYRIILSDLDNYLRSRLKYEKLSESVHEALQAARDKLWELVKDENVEI